MIINFLRIIKKQMKTWWLLFVYGAGHCPHVFTEREHFTLIQVSTQNSCKMGATSGSRSPQNA